MKVPALKVKGHVYVADSGIPLAKAAAEGKVQFHGLHRGHHPGRRLPRHELVGLTTIGYWDTERPQDWGCTWHRNEGIEITFIERGHTSFLVEDQEYGLRPGDITITRPWQLHQVGNPGIGPGRLHWLVLDVGVRQPHQEWRWPAWVVLSRTDLDELTRMLRHNEQPVWRGGQEVERCYERLGSAVRAACAGSSVSRIAVSLNDLLLLLLDLLRAKKVRLDERLASTERTVSLFLQELAVTSQEEWTVQRMARRCGLGVTRFTHFCRLATNLSPMQHLARLRLDAAARLLAAQSDASITRIAFDCGFASSQYFATAFRARFGCTPRAYRARR